MSEGNRRAWRERYCFSIIESEKEMEITRVAKTEARKQVDSSVRQRGFRFDEPDRSHGMGEEVQDSGTMLTDKDDARNSEQTASAHQLGRSNPSQHSEDDEQEEQSRERGMEGQSRFSSQFAAEAFDKLTARQQQYLTIYFTTGSPTLTAHALGLRSTKNVGKEIKRLSRAIGFSSVAAMNKDAGVKHERHAVSATSRQLMQLIEEQGYRCALTGKQLTPETARLDHKKPVAEGGSHEVENLQWVMWNVNTAKGVMGMDEFVGMCADVTRWAQL